jgi:toxin HigB-1
MIESFADRPTADLFNGVNSGDARKRLPQELWRTAFRKLDQIDAAIEINDLRVPPGNRLEALKGDRVGQYSVRINDQYRICFEWKSGNASNVEIVDYH